MTKKELALETVARLKKEYPDAGCTLSLIHISFFIFSRIASTKLYHKFFLQSVSIVMINNLWYNFVEAIRENIKKDVKLWTFIWEDQIGKH